MSAHTPGPWEVDRPFEGHVASGDRLIASAMGHYDGKEETREQNRCNARLIAAAPELLDALKHLVGYTADDTVTIAARAAIAKAEGRS